MVVDPICSLVLDTDVHRQRIQIARETQRTMPALFKTTSRKIDIPARVFVVLALKRNKAYPTCSETTYEPWIYQSGQSQSLKINAEQAVYSLEDLYR